MNDQQAGGPVPRRRWRRVLLGGAVAAVALLGALLWNTYRTVSKQLQVPPAEPLPLAEGEVLGRFSEAISFPTISADLDANEQPFDDFQRWVEEQFPEVHQRPLELLTGEEFGDARNRSLLIRWPGSDVESEPILLMSHYDVVRVARPAQWKHGPFTGHVGETYVWGRGTLDVKDGAVGLLEAIRYLRRAGHQPRRTIYVSLGHDEEIGGSHGNRRIAEWMARQGIRLSWVLDEGGCIYSGLPGIDRPVALVGVSEKGYRTVQLKVEVDQPGHSSMPPSRTAIGIIAEAVTRIEQSPFPMRFDGGSGLMLDYLGPEMPLLGRVVATNRWLFGPLIKRQLASSPAGNAMLRTTVAPTIVGAGEQANVLPERAAVTLSVRILPGDSPEAVLARLRTIVGECGGDDCQLELIVREAGREPSPVSSVESEAFELLHRTIRESYPDVLVAPFVLVGATDSSHFQPISRNIYRFMPARLDEQGLKRIHGTNERIAKQDYLDLIRYYVRLIRRAT